jgi:3-oxoacyl-[acyl-carrier protein] reductase
LDSILSQFDKGSKIIQMKNALITGGSGGMGQAIALQLAKDGYNIILHYHKSRGNALRTKKLIENIGQECIIISADLTKDNEVANLFKTLNQRIDHLDLLVNNAGFDYGYLFEDYSFKQMRYVFDIIMWAKITVTKYALPFLKKSATPAIINTTSRMGKEKTIKSVSIYGPAQAGVIKFTQCCALEFSEYKIRVNAIAPGLTNTKFNDTIFAREEGSIDKVALLWNEMAKNNPSGRVCDPQDVANLVSFLASDKASYINGETIGINGGSNLG